MYIYIRNMYMYIYYINMYSIHGGEHVCQCHSWTKTRQFRFVKEDHSQSLDFSFSTNIR